MNSILDAWGIWARLWPLEILALATGFLFAAIYRRVVWLLVPAIIIGLNAIVFQFCAATGLWGTWAFLWLIEPLSVGLALLVVGAATQRAGLSTAGLVLCYMAGVGWLVWPSSSRAGDPSSTGCQHPSFSPALPCWLGDGPAPAAAPVSPGVERRLVQF